MAQRLQLGFWPGNQRDIIETCAQKRHLVSNLFALGARVVVASRLTIVSPCGVRRECAPRKLLGATCGRRAPLPCFRLSCLGGTPLPLRMKLSIDKVQRGEKPPPAAKSGGEGLPAGGPWLMLPLGRLGGTPAMSGLCFGHSDCNRRAPSHAVMYRYNFDYIQK